MTEPRATTPASTAPAFDAALYLNETHAGEILGEALFARLAELDDDVSLVEKWRCLERLERYVGSRFRAVIEARDPSADLTAADKLAEGKQLAATLHSLPAESRMSAFIPSIEGFVAGFRDSEALAPPELADVARLATTHEEALLSFFQREAAGQGETSCDAVLALLERAGAPEEAPLPDGLALTPLDPGFREDPNARYRVLHERAPVRRDRALGDRLVLVGHDDVMEIVRDLSFWVDPRKSVPDDPVRMFSSEADLEPSMLFLDDPAHRRLRNFVSRDFTPRAVDRMRPVVVEVARSLVDTIEASGEGEFDLIEHLAAPLPAIAIAKLLGVDTAKQAQFKAWSVASSESFFNPFGSPELRAAGEEASARLQETFREEIAKRRAHPSDDLIGKMVAAEEQGDRLTEVEIVTQCGLLLIAGNVTTTDLIGNGVKALLEHPSQLAKLQARPELIENAVEEMLRFDPPVTHTGRIAPRDIEIDGIPVKKGESITFVLAAANRDPAVYPEPDRFDIEREDTHHQSFGGGAHLCLGAHLARLETQEAIGQLVARFPKLRRSDRPPVYKQTPSFRGMSEYWVRIDSNPARVAGRAPQPPACSLR